ncbi:hypothetical protein [Nocardia sp. NPDC049526]|uniref:hypothetical protein n=1 Tax=Nocardia sp. NPDC049526 TaxID=3364316 RepID=UPI0037877C5D
MPGTSAAQALAYTANTSHKAQPMRGTLGVRHKPAERAEWREGATTEHPDMTAHTQ